MNKINFLAKSCSNAAILFAIAAVVFLAFQSLPIAQPLGVVYPAPLETSADRPGENLIFASATLSPEEAYCDEWYAYRRQMPEEAKKMLEEAYQRCVIAWKTPSPSARSTMRSIENNGQARIVTSSIHRPAGVGEIIEENGPAFSSRTEAINLWTAEVNGDLMRVFAGGRLANPNNPSPPHWLGNLFVLVTDANHQIIKEKCGSYLTPFDAGMIRIVDAEGMVLKLAAQDGSSFLFDLEKRQYLSSKAGPPLSRVVGGGLLTESGVSPYSPAGYEFMNQWSTESKGTGKITLLAGRQTSDPQYAALVLVRTSAGDDTKVWEETTYLLRYESILRIIDVDEEKITLVETDGQSFEFDLAARSYISANDELYLAPIPLITAATLSNELSPKSAPPTRTSFFQTPTRTRTPRYTRTPTPTRTRTPTPPPTMTTLPTYNPYP